MQYDLRCVKGGCVGRTVRVAQDQRLVFGRAKDSDVEFRDPLVSRMHCEIHNLNTGLSIFDLKSWNGTYVNGTRITAPTTLRHQDRIVIGANLLEVLEKASTSIKEWGTGIDFNADVSTSDGWNPARSCPAARSANQQRAASQSWAPNMVRGYQIDSKIGVGAVGTVFRAIHKRTGQTIALKIVDPAYVSTPNAIKRFLRAAKLCKEIVHPNIMQIRDIGEASGIFYIVMEHIPGRTAGDIISQYGHISVRSTLQIGMQIASALQYAFERSIIHRDIKPKNIMVTRTGVAKLVDFGLAKRLHRKNISQLTAPGEAVGTLAYMPPEQLDDALHADHRSDIYSLGATLYHMLCGEYPFHKPTFPEFVTAIMTTMPLPLHERNPALPLELDAIISRALAKDPGDRYQTPREMFDDLRFLSDVFSCDRMVASPNAKTTRLPATNKDHATRLN